MPFEPPATNWQFRNRTRASQSAEPDAVVVRLTPITEPALFSTVQRSRMRAMACPVVEEIQVAALLPRLISELSVQSMKVNHDGVVVAELETTPGLVAPDMDVMSAKEIFVVVVSVSNCVALGAVVSFVVKAE
jgi:hypothetical protein